MKSSRQNRHRPHASVRGFTLIEALVVMGVLAVVSALLLPMAARGRALARESRCKQGLRDLGAAITLDYMNGWLPETVRLASYRPAPRSAPSLRFPGAQPACWPPPPAPPAVTEDGRSTRADYPLLAKGHRCPDAPANPLYALNPEDEPPFLSYGFLSYNLGRHWLDTWNWLAADATSAYIVHEMNVDTARHPYGANILFRDGSVLCLKPAQILFPPVAP